MIRGAKFPPVHTSWDVPAGNDINAFVPVIETVASPTGLMKVHVPLFREQLLKSSETIADCSEEVMNVRSVELDEFPFASAEVIR
jgi:hypothetical protein